MVKPQTNTWNKVEKRKRVKASCVDFFEGPVGQVDGEITANSESPISDDRQFGELVVRNGTVGMQWVKSTKLEGTTRTDIHNTRVARKNMTESDKRRPRSQANQTPSCLEACRVGTHALLASHRVE